MDDKQKPKKCLGRFETSYMKDMAAPEASDYPPKTRDYGQFMKVLTNLEMNKKFQFPTGIPKYKYDFCGEKYPVPGDKKPPSKPPLNYKPGCPQYAPFHSTMEDMTLISRRLETEPEHEHTWYREKKPPRKCTLDDLFKPPAPSTGDQIRMPERSFRRLERVHHETRMQDEPETILGPYYNRLHVPSSEVPWERTKMPNFVIKKRKQPTPPPRRKPEVPDRIIFDTSRASKEATTTGFAHSMALRAGAMLQPPEKDPRAKPKESIHNFFAQGSSNLNSDNGDAMAECFYAHARPYEGALFTIRAEKALNSRYF